MPKKDKQPVPDFKGMHDRLAYIQQHLAAPKERVNAERGNEVWHWRSAEDILLAVKPLLAVTGCTLVLSEEPLLVGVSLYQKCTATITDADGQSMSATTAVREDWSDKLKCAAQISGSAVSYARKYALCGLFAIDGGAPVPATDPDYKSSLPVPAPEPQAPQQPRQTDMPTANKKELPKEGTTSWKKGVELAQNGNYSRETLRKALGVKYLFSDEEFDAFAKAAGL